MKSMENFFNWMSKPIPKDDVILWLNIHNMNYEKIELFGDFFKSLNQIIFDTYLGEEMSETKIDMTEEDKISHFDWCWEKTLQNFKKENITVRGTGQHYDYLKSFFLDTFYNPKDKKLKIAISEFIDDIFNMDKPFSKSDLDLLTEFYQMIDKNLE
jgi:hypothetical protein